MRRNLGSVEGGVGVRWAWLVSCSVLHRKLLTEPFLLGVSIGRESCPRAGGIDSKRGRKLDWDTDKLLALLIPPEVHLRLPARRPALSLELGRIVSQTSIQAVPLPFGRHARSRR
jgi:hypothetical protein